MVELLNRKSTDPTRDEGRRKSPRQGSGRQAAHSYLTLVAEEGEEEKEDEEEEKKEEKEGQVIGTETADVATVGKVSHNAVRELL